MQPRRACMETFFRKQRVQQETNARRVQHWFSRVSGESVLPLNHRTGAHLHYSASTHITQCERHNSDIFANEKFQHYDLGTSTFVDKFHSPLIFAFGLWCKSAQRARRQKHAHSHRLALTHMWNEGNFSSAFRIDKLLFQYLMLLFALASFFKLKHNSHSFNYAKKFIIRALVFIPLKDVQISGIWAEASASLSESNETCAISSRRREQWQKLQKEFQNKEVLAFYCTAICVYA